MHVRALMIIAVVIFKLLIQRICSVLSIVILRLFPADNLIIEFDVVGVVTSHLYIVRVHID